MTQVPDDRRYTAEHEWAKEEGGRVLVGITDHAQDQLGDIVFVQLPEPGTEVTANQALGEVESTKSVSEIYSPLSGRVVDKNARVEQNPELINEDPYGDGWLVALEAEEGIDSLMSAQDYLEHIGG